METDTNTDFQILHVHIFYRGWNKVRAQRSQEADLVMWLEGMS